MRSTLKIGKWERALVGGAVVLLVAFAFHPLGTIVVLGPLVLALVGIFVFYRVVLRSVPTEEPSLSERWADGQPLGTARQNEESRLVAEAKRQQEREEQARQLLTAQAGIAAEARLHDEADYQGPPPVVPFP